MLYSSKCYIAPCCQIKKNIEPASSDDVKTLSSKRTRGDHREVEQVGDCQEVEQEGKEIYIYGYQRIKTMMVKHLPPYIIDKQHHPTHCQKQLLIKMD